MLKKIIAYQRLLLNSSPPFTATPPTLLNGIFYCLAFAMIVFMNISLFFGNTVSSSTFIPFTLPIIIIWMINRIIHGDHRLFETVPVSRKYAVLNIFFLPIVMIFIMYILLFISSLSLLDILFGIVYLTNLKSGNGFPPKSSMQQIIDTKNGDILMLCILIIIIFVGVAITLIKNKKLRLITFAGFATIGYGMLIFLKLNMPIFPSTGKVEFLESYSLMPQSNIILICVAIATVTISITSIFIGYKLYVGKSIHKNSYSIN